MTAIRVPGDKSISHRALMIGCLGEAAGRLAGLPDSADVRSTLEALRQLGGRFEPDGPSALVVRPPDEWNASPGNIDCGNSGTTARLLSGLLVGLGVEARLNGDASLTRRPMDRVVYPLQAMGGRLRYLEIPDRLPIEVGARRSGTLRVLRYRGRVASAQVKSALLLAGLAGGVETEVREPGISRDHTERLLGGLGAPITYGAVEDGGASVLLEGSVADFRLPAIDFVVPGDLSSAAYLLAAGLLAGADVRLEGVGLNPTRTGALDVLKAMGADVQWSVREERLREPVGTVDVRPGSLSAFEIEPTAVASLIDEIPILAILASRAKGISTVSGATELRLKESDRISALVANLESLGVRCGETEDGMWIEGSTKPLSGRVRTEGDHRIAMAFGVLGTAEECDITLDDPGCVAVSYPGFWEDLHSVTVGASRR